MYDVIIVGARVAGSSTAMLLAGKGLRVLLVDRAAFPSDTLSTHQVQLPGGARLRRWGLLDQVVASGAPPAREVRFDAGSVVLQGRYPAFEGVDAVYSPRRTVLDALLLEAARAAGAEVREQFIVEELTVEDGRVTGIRGRAKGGQPRHRGGPAGRRRRRQALAGRQDGGRARPPRPAAADHGLLHLLARRAARRGRDLRPAAAGDRRLADQRRADADVPGLAGRGVPGLPGRRRRRTSCAPSTWPATWASGSGPAAAPSGSGPAPTCPASSAGRTGRAGRWSGTPAW